MKPTTAQVRALKRADPVLAEAMKRVPAYPGFPEGRPSDTHYHALARAIVYQQLATKAAFTIHARVKALTPGPRFPKQEELLALSDTALRGAGLSQAKMLAMRDLAAKTTDGTVKLRSLGRRSDEEIIETLTQIRGIGVWTAQMFLMFRLGRLDVMPAGDLGVQNGMQILDGLKERPTEKELLARAEVWRPLRTVASWVCWRLTDK